MPVGIGILVSETRLRLRDNCSVMQERSVPNDGIWEDSVTRHFHFQFAAHKGQLAPPIFQAQPVPAHLDTPPHELDRTVMRGGSSQLDPPVTTVDGLYKPPPHFTTQDLEEDPSHINGTSDEIRLRAHLKTLSADKLLDRLVSAELRLEKWEAAASDLVTTLALSPEMTEAYYARSLRELLSGALLTLDAISELRHVECAMPCVAAEAPGVAMLDWQGLPFSTWDIDWAPHSWWVSVSAVGSRWGLGFNSLTRVSGIHLKGELRCAFSRDLTSLRISFVTKPLLEMDIESSVGWGAVPIPVREQIEAMVRVEIEHFVESRLTGDESMVIVLRRKALTKLSESDILEATEQAKRANSIKLRSALLM